MITFENENARLLCKDIIQYYPLIRKRGEKEDIEISEEIALTMYNQVHDRYIKLRSITCIPVYNIIAE